MAFERILHDHNHNAKAGADINPRVALKLGGTSGLLAFPVATSNDRPAGANQAATCLSGEQVVVQGPGNIIKLRAAASVGAGAEVMVASTNGALGPAGANLIAASGHWAVGVAHSPAAAGELFSVEILPRKA